MPARAVLDELMRVGAVERLEDARLQLVTHGYVPQHSAIDKLAATQELQRKDTEIAIEAKEKTKREVQAEGIANAMRIIRGQLTNLYVQHEAIEAQKSMVGSPNHTVVYIPVGPMGVPLTGTFPATTGREAPPAATPAVKK